MNIVISGATGGVGEAVAKLFASKGCSIILLGRDIKKLSKLSKGIIKKHKVEVSFFKCDIDNRGELSSSIKKINELNIDIDILINIAGIFPYGPVLNQNERIFDNCMDVNLKLPYLLSLGLFDSIKKNKGGKIINIGSSSSYSGFKNTVTYCASKHALLGLSRALNDEWRDHGISVHCISPGTIDTEMANPLSQDSSTYITVEEFSQLIYDVTSYNGNMLVDEVRAVRRIIR
jgi:short-subunit dehydrogenase